MSWGCLSSLLVCRSASLHSKKDGCREGHTFSIRLRSPPPLLHRRPDATRLDKLWDHYDAVAQHMPEFRGVRGRRRGLKTQRGLQ
eukprot:gene25217-biopygen17989